MDFGGSHPGRLPVFAHPSQRVREPGKEANWSAVTGRRYIGPVWASGGAWPAGGPDPAAELALDSPPVRPTQRLHCLLPQEVSRMSAPHSTTATGSPVLREI